MTFYKRRGSIKTYEFLEPIDSADPSSRFYEEYQAGVGLDPNDPEYGVDKDGPYILTRYRNTHPRHVSDADWTRKMVSSGYFKKHGKRAGRRLQRRTGKSPTICREPKHLP